MLQALRTRGVLLTLAAAATVAALGSFAFMVDSLPFWARLVRPFMRDIGFTFVTIPTVAWLLLTGATFACAVREAEHHRQGNKRWFVGLGVGLTAISVGSILWWAEAYGSLRIEHSGQLISLAFIAGLSIIAIQLFAISRQSATPGSATSALVALAGVGVGISSVIFLFGLVGLTPVDYYSIGLAVGIGLVGIAFLLAGGLRLGSPATLLALGVGLLLVAFGTGAIGMRMNLVQAHRLAASLVVGFCVLAITAGLAAARTPPSDPSAEVSSPLSTTQS